MIPDFGIYRTTPAGERIDGVCALAFVHNAEYHLTPIRVYRDGLIDCWGLVGLDEFRKRVRAGWVVTAPPPDARVSVWSLGTFTAQRAHYWVEPEDFVQEVADAIEELNGRPTSADRCRPAWAAYQVAPTALAAEAVRAAYASIPKHRLRFALHEFDDSRHPIYAVLNSEHSGASATESQPAPDDGR